MKRLLFNFLAAVSLLLFLALCAAWVRSFWTADQVHLWYGPVNVAKDPERADSEGIGIHHFSGSVVIQRFPRMHRWAGRDVQWDYRALPPEVLGDAFAPLWSIGQAWSFLGFGYASRRRRISSSLTTESRGGWRNG